MHSVITVTVLPPGSLDASQAFGEKWLPKIREQLSAGADVTALLPPATYDHADWRRALVRDLARAYAPRRVNFICGTGEQSLGETATFLKNAPGVTGQYLVTGDDG